MAGLSVNVWAYNRRRKPWRRFRQFKTTAAARCQKRVRRCLIAVLAAELAYAALQQPALLRRVWTQLFDITMVTEKETVTGTDGKEAPAGKKERGMDIDLRRGLIRFWRLEEEIYQDENQNDK